MEEKKKSEFENNEQEDLQEYWSYLSNNNNANIGNLKDRIKEDKNTNKKIEREEKYTSGFTILGHIDVFCSIILLIILCVVFPEPATIVSFITSSIISIACLYGLGGARERINYLEDDMSEIIKENKAIHKKLKQLEKEVRYKADKRDLNNKE